MYTECGGEITSPGLIESPTSNNEYNVKTGEYHYVNCTWIVRAPSDQIIQIAYVSICSLILIYLLTIKCLFSVLQNSN